MKTKEEEAKEVKEEEVKEVLPFSPPMKEGIFYGAYSTTRELEQKIGRSEEEEEGEDEEHTCTCKKCLRNRHKANNQ